MDIWHIVAISHNRKLILKKFLFLWMNRMSFSSSVYDSFQLKILFIQWTMPILGAVHILRHIFFMVSSLLTTIEESIDKKSRNYGNLSKLLRGIQLKIPQIKFSFPHYKIFWLLFKKWDKNCIKINFPFYSISAQKHLIRNCYKIIFHFHFLFKMLQLNSFQNYAQQIYIIN